MSVEISEVKSLLQKGQLDTALKQARELIKVEPDNIEALYFFAVSSRYANDFENAIETLLTLLDKQPIYARAYQEIGHNFKAKAQLDKAIQAYDHAVKLNSTLLASWSSLSELQAKQGNLMAAEAAKAEYEWLNSLPTELIQVRSLINEDQLYHAESLCRTYLKANPKSVEGMRLLALLGVRQSVYDDAEFLLESCLTFEPDNWRARNDYVTVLSKRQKFKKALHEAQKLCDDFPNNMAFELNLANQSVATGNFDQALQLYEKITERFPKLDVAHLMKGHALKTSGDIEKGVQAYRSAYAARPDYGDAYWSLANLKTYRFSELELTQMKEQTARKDIASNDLFHVYFALGKAYEDLADYAQSFDFYEQGNHLKRSEVRYSADSFSVAVDRQIKTFDTHYFGAHSGASESYSDPIFIVGLPRVGSTLLEQILSSHSKVDGTTELPNIIALSRMLNGRVNKTEKGNYPEILGTLGPDMFNKFAKQFIQSTQFYRSGAPFFIDKMPNNFLHIGMISMMFPQAKIIDARRHPMATCFSGYKQLFADGQEFTYSQQNIAKYYKDYVRLMAHWDKVLPGRILRVNYENVVADLETQVSRILDFCDLEFESSCIDFYKTKRSVRTPSSEQVRQPIYKKGLEQWRYYEPHLESMLSELKPLIEAYEQSCIETRK